jgi:hypothetical protein
MNSQYVALAVIVLLFVFPSIRKAIFDMIIPRSLYTSSDSKSPIIEKMNRPAAKQQAQTNSMLRQLSNFIRRL